MVLSSKAVRDTLHYWGPSSLERYLPRPVRIGGSQWLFWGLSPHESPRWLRGHLYVVPTCFKGYLYPCVRIFTLVCPIFGHFDTSYVWFSGGLPPAPLCGQLLSGRRPDHFCSRVHSMECLTLANSPRPVLKVRLSSIKLHTLEVSSHYESRAIHTHFPPQTKQQWNFRFSRDRHEWPPLGYQHTFNREITMEL